MTFNPSRHHRRSIRLRGYDYTRAGAYFVTICTYDRGRVFGDVVDGAMQLNDAGQIVRDTWDALTRRFPPIDLDASVVMPNHFHGIIVVTGGTTDDRANASMKGGAASCAPTIGVGTTMERSLVETDVGVGAGLALPNANPTEYYGATGHGPNASMKGGAASCAPTCANSTLGDVVRAFKSISANSLNRLLGRVGQPLWQRNYYEHIIRNADSLNRIRRYIVDNPAHWEFDRNSPNVEELMEAEGAELPTLLAGKSR